MGMGEDGQHRCDWCGDNPLYMAYHDEEWGVPIYDDRALFEKLILDGFQAGLSWITICANAKTSLTPSTVSSLRLSPAMISGRSKS